MRLCCAASPFLRLMIDGTVKNYARTGTLHHLLEVLHKAVSRTADKAVRVVYWTSQEPQDITNAICILGAYLVTVLGATVDEAWRPFEQLPEWLPCRKQPMCLMFRDATWVKSSFDLHVKDCWAGLQRAVSQGLYDFNRFDKHEYFYYDSPDNGDLHMVVPGKFIAFRGPCDEQADYGCGSLRPADFLEVFKCLDVHTVVRLNRPAYRKSVFKNAGFKHLDLFFADCSVPSDSVVDAFLTRAEALAPGQVMARGFCSCIYQASLVRLGSCDVVARWQHADRKWHCTLFSWAGDGSALSRGARTHWDIDSALPDEALRIFSERGHGLAPHLPPRFGHRAAATVPGGSRRKDARARSHESGGSRT